MSRPYRTELLAGDGRPVLRKVAEDEVGRAVLEREADRLRRGRHPGLVRLLHAEPGRIDVDWAGAETLVESQRDATDLAAAIAAVAATVAHLHRCGIVHGRITSGHVILDAEGRARLAGLGGVIPRVPPTPADDVSDVGRLLDRVLDAPAPTRPRGWGRGGEPSQVDALAAIRDQACDPDPARRPTARALAQALARVAPPLAYPPDPEAEPDDGPVERDEPEAEDRPVDVEVEVERDRGPLELSWLDDVPAPVGPAADGPVAPTWTPPPERRRPRTAVLVTVGAALAGAALLIGRRPAPAPTPTTVAAPAGGGPTVATSTAPTSTDPPCPGAVVGGPDVDGDGCGDEVRIAPGGVQANGIRYAVGRTGDRIAVADWDCDGVATPGLVRPATGEVFLFRSWALGDDRVVAHPTIVVPGASVLVPTSNSGPCRPGQVRTTAGALHPLPGGSR